MYKLSQCIALKCANNTNCNIIYSVIFFNISIPLYFHAAPSVPLNLTFTPGSVLNDSITLTWLTPQHPSGAVRFYELQWSSSGSVFNINTTDNTTTIVLSNLTPGTQYNFAVRAFTVAFGPFSAQLILHTADGEDTCSTISERRECPPVPYILES